ncbi:hypothetical protein [Aureispira sp. CCB-QB1]|uniref:hypothetical protein n=1 Tax=Aureispira sp. CCB-QB1 TaxID=1313421 RepID=UPI0012DD5C83|nr:hypothetical protein [Aureispira sp. CCB-QB1]
MSNNVLIVFIIVLFGAVVYLVLRGREKDEVYSKYQRIVEDPKGAKMDGLLNNS